MAKGNKVLKQAEVLMEDKDLTDELAADIERQRGVLGFLLSTLRERPRTFNPYLLKGRSVYNPASLDRKTAELVAVASASALRCEHCLDAHIAGALRAGATMEEIMDVILISGAISESSTLSVAFRKFKQQEAKLRRKKGES